jgi:hypothetical protein
LSTCVVEGKNVVSLTEFLKKNLNAEVHKQCILTDEFTGGTFEGNIFLPRSIFTRNSKHPYCFISNTNNLAFIFNDSPIKEEVAALVYNYFSVNDIKCSSYLIIYTTRDSVTIEFEEDSSWDHEGNGKLY